MLPTARGQLPHDALPGSNPVWPALSGRYVGLRKMTSDAHQCEARGVEEVTEPRAGVRLRRARPVGRRRAVVEVVRRRHARRVDGAADGGRAAGQRRGEAGSKSRGGLDALLLDHCFFRAAYGRRSSR